MSHGRRWILVLLTVLGLSGTVLAKEKVSRGAMLAMPCYACHNTGGNSQGAIPAINRMSAAGMEKILFDYKNGKKQGTMMNRHAKAYSDEDIRLIARYITRNKPKKK